MARRPALKSSQPKVSAVAGLSRSSVRCAGRRTARRVAALRIAQADCWTVASLSPRRTASLVDADRLRPVCPAWLATRTGRHAGGILLDEQLRTSAASSPGWRCSARWRSATASLNWRFAARRYRAAAPANRRCTGRRRQDMHLGVPGLLRIRRLAVHRPGLAAAEQGRGVAELGGPIVRSAGACRTGDSPSPADRARQAPPAAASGAGEIGRGLILIAGRRAPADQRERRRRHPAGPRSDGACRPRRRGRSSATAAASSRRARGWSAAADEPGRRAACSSLPVWKSIALTAGCRRASSRRRWCDSRASGQLKLRRGPAPPPDRRHGWPLARV